MKSKALMTAGAFVLTGAALTGLGMAFTAPQTVQRAENKVAPTAIDVNAGNFQLDPVHSSVVFGIQHNGVATFYGRFNKMQGAINWHPDNLIDSRIALQLDAASVDTNNDRRDGHLRSPDFFNVAEFPHITFTSSAIERDGDAYKVHGTLDMHGVRKPLTVDLRQTGSVEHRSGRELIGLEGRATINRSQWGMNYGIEAGALGDEVKLIISMEALANE